MRALILLLIAIPAMACLNDREVVRRDREFRSSYGDLPGSESDAVVLIKTVGPIITILGVGAYVIAIWWRRRGW